MKKLVLIAALGVCFAGSVFAQAKPADPAVTACMKDLTTEYQALLKDHKEDNKNVSGKEEAAYKAMLNRLKTDWANARKDGVSVKDCTDQRAKIKSTQANLNKMQADSVAANSSPTACLAEIKKVASEADKIFAEGVAKKTIDDKEAAAYKARDAAFGKQYAAAAADKKLSKTECDGLLKTANDEKAMVMKMVSATPAPAGAAAPAAQQAAAPADLAACRADLDKQYRALLADHDGGKKNINPAEEQRYQGMLAKLKSDWTAMGKDGVSIAECKTQISNMGRVQQELNRMQATPSIRTRPQ